MRDENAGECFARDDDEKIVLVVPEEDVIFRALAFDACRFLDERFDLGGERNDPDRARLGAQALDFTGSGWGKVRADSLAEIRDLADVEHVVARADEKVKPGRVGDFVG